ncbi:LacI family DNA-binding transcriptional regulator [Bifidobacterium oedipodis]|uniref:LacI family transcriptional regulator n=1 Tax=Bifidobacterium oedipodis TaxID=2675322 RepID=A0A7Y0EMK7_9BIFI|nr:LacI family DNA-binding transcriptional regulator [Bifidobacterium sp. DSM 109957]NMM93055.1 LacI family transcriptional regulator [Bifidobacterium sp. DSM 109957]
MTDNQHDDEGKVTIRDVAKAAGVSPSTVSRAFARPDRVSAATAKRIFSVADQLGYHSDPVETMPSRGLKGMIAIIVPDIANQFMSDMIRAVQHEAASHGVALVVSESRESASWERTSFDRIVPYVDGVILASSRMPDAMIRKCAQTRPVVVANREVRGVDNVTCDLTQGIAQLVDHIVKQGYSRVTYLDGPASSWSAGVRWNAMSRGLASRGVTARRIWPGSPTFEGGFAQAQKYLEDPTGMVVTHNDLMALGFIAAMRRLGYDCPKDFGVAGFDNDAVGQIYSPTLTSVRMSPALLGQRAARLLLAKLQHVTSTENLAHVATSLVVRESSCRVASMD